ncbi:MAG: 1,4-dihydroxy-6-naphthoate synthase [Nannocystaceae bacterium]
MTGLVGPAVRVGFSSCPNDTFMFHALVHGRVAAPVPGHTCEPVIEDIEALNKRALRPEDSLLLTKLSVGALGHVSDRYSVLDSGAALGRGCGPIVVCRADSPRVRSLEALAGARVAVPGLNTTACLLLRIFAPDTLQMVPMRFERVMPAVASGAVDAGLIIHEARFTFKTLGLEAVADLGQRWEEETALPLPLGVICVARSVEDASAAGWSAALRASILYARRHPHVSAGYVRRLAQEMDPEVIRRHIALYVNDDSLALGSAGRAAIEELLLRGRTAGWIPASGGSPWRRPAGPSM